jgi:hypothetical protein
MGQSQSVQIQSEINREAGVVVAASSEKKTKMMNNNNNNSLDNSNLNGQKTQTNNKGLTLKNMISNISSEGHDYVDDDDDTTTVASYEDDDDFDTDEEEEEEEEEDIDEELEEFLSERKMILQEARKLRAMAEFYYYSPEMPIAVDGTALARCYFDRYSADQQTSMEMEQEREMALQDAVALKKLAVDYLEPERPVQVTDPTIWARSYFDRYYSQSDPIADAADEEAEYQKIIKDMKQLKATATWYLHPEKPVECDGFAMGRDYFSRPSAEKYEDDAEEDIERERILKDMAHLKTTAEWYLKPELPVAVDATCFGRNYFSRPSAPE